MDYSQFTLEKLFEVGDELKKLAQTENYDFTRGEAVSIFLEEERNSILRAIVLKLRTNLDSHGLNGFKVKT